MKKEVLIQKVSIGEDYWKLRSWGARGTRSGGSRKSVEYLEKCLSCNLYNRMSVSDSA